MRQCPIRSGAFLDEAIRRSRPASSTGREMSPVFGILPAPFVKMREPTFADDRFGARMNSMTTTLQNDPVLARFRAALVDTYGAKIERVVLFGSRARGNARADSDYDIAVFLHDMPHRAREMNRLADIGTEILYDIGGVIHAMPYRAGSYRDRTPLMHQIRLDGVDL